LKFPLVSSFCGLALRWHGPKESKYYGEVAVEEKHPRSISWNHLNTCKIPNVELSKTKARIGR